MISSFDISSSALVAQRARLNAISSNIANMSTQKNENGEIEPYEARYVVFQTDDQLKSEYGAVGVKVASVETEQVEPIYKYEPQNPMAGDDGYVAYPRVNMMAQFVNALEATRAYEANIGVMEATKDMGAQTLRIIA